MHKLKALTVKNLSLSTLKNLLKSIIHNLARDSVRMHSAMSLMYAKYLSIVCWLLVYLIHTSIELDPTLLSYKCVCVHFRLATANCFGPKYRSSTTENNIFNDSINLASRKIFFYEIWRTYFVVCRRID